LNGRRFVRRHCQFRVVRRDPACATLCRVTEWSTVGKPGKGEDWVEVKDRNLWEAVRGDASEGYLFDEMTRALTVGPSRRQALRLMAGGALAALFGWGVGVDEVGAIETRRTDRSCRDKPAISNTVCPRFRKCRGKNFCTCARTVGGDKKCVDLRSAHCPTVDECDGDRDCPAGAVCVKVGACCGNTRRNACFRQCP
jgi:hypothetical protein